MGRIMFLRDKLWPGIRLWNSSDLFDDLWKSTQNEQKYVSLIVFLIFCFQIKIIAHLIKNLFFVIFSVVPVPGRHLVVAGFRWSR